jgi:hypothetical protein
MNSQKTKTFVSPLQALFTCILVVFSVAAFAEQDVNLRFVRTIDTDDLFSAEYFSAAPHPDLSGVGFPPGAQSLLVFNQPSGTTSLVLAEPPKNKNDKVGRTALAIADPINIAFDSVSVGAKGFGLARLFLWDSDSGKLITVRSTPRNVMDKNRIKRFNVFAFGVNNPQGLTLNPDSRQLFALDADNSRIVTIDPRPGHEFVGSEMASMALPKGLGDLRGLAFNPADQHFYVLNPSLQTLYKLTMQGDLVATLAIADQKLGLPQGMVFAPSLDPTDDASIFHLYVVTKQGTQGEISEWALTGPF